jgi:hypothetical protein
MVPVAQPISVYAEAAPAQAAVPSILDGSFAVPSTVAAPMPMDEIEELAPFVPLSMRNGHDKQAEQGE